MTIALESYAKQVAKIQQRKDSGELTPRQWQIRATVLLMNIADEGEKLLAAKVERE